MVPERKHINSINKAVKLLDCFWEEKKPLSVKELSRKTGWPKSTIYGFLATLTDCDILEQNASDGRYMLGFHLFELGNAVNSTWNVVAAAKDYMRNIVAVTKESVYLARFSKNEMLIVDSAEPNDTFRVVSEVGSRLPLYCSSQGKLILAYKSPGEVRSILKRTEMRAFTPNTITDIDLLLEQLEQIRMDGYATENEEFKNGLQSIAAPIFDSDGECRYALGVVCISRTIHQVELLRAKKLVIEAAAAISKAV